MISGITIWSIHLVILLVVLHQSSCQGYQMMATYPLGSSTFDERQIFRRDHESKQPKADSGEFTKLSSDIFGSSEESSDRNRIQEENDSSLLSDEASMLDLPIGHPSKITKRRKGPTLSVVNPLEILRQRLMLDLARRRIQENQQQIVANGELLERIGKRSSQIMRHHQEEVGALRDSSYQP